ncbi:MAG: hypothetical protein JRG91_13865 [Deltaproteobacteria bacterium]|nr:hypothetical protein [Deltaproteobacteria bacterium]
MIKIILIASITFMIAACSTNFGNEDADNDPVTEPSGDAEFEAEAMDDPVEEVLPTFESVCDDGEDNDGDTLADCEDDDCTFAAVTGDTGSCINESDLTITKELNYDLEWNACVVTAGCMTDVACNTTCFQENTGLSEDCSRCFAEMVRCIVLSCAGPCSGGGGSPECFECMGTNCSPGYSECFGELACPYEYACIDHFDNDGDTLIDYADPDC